MIERTPAVADRRCVCDGARHVVLSALGRALPDAAGRAQQYVSGAITHAPAIGHGRGPLNHFWGGILKG